MPAFLHFWPNISPLESTLIDRPASVDSKSLTQDLSPLDATLTKNTGRGPVIVNQESEKDFCPEEHRDEGSLYASDEDARILTKRFESKNLSSQATKQVYLVRKEFRSHSTQNA